MAAKIFKEGGKGRKQCPRCKVYIAAKLAACPACHKLFEEVEEDNEPIVLPEATRTVPVKKAQKKQTGKQPAPTWAMRITGLRIPDGANPVPLKGKDKASLLKWAEAVREHWLHKQYWLLKEGLCYYLLWEPQFEYNEKAQDAARKIIEDNLSDDMPEAIKP